MRACAADIQELVNTYETGSLCMKKPAAKTKSENFRSVDMGLLTVL